MNASPPVVVANPAAQGQHVLPVQQGVASQRQVVVIQAPSSPPLVMGSLQRGCVLGMGITQLAIGIFSFIFQIGAFIVPTSFTIYSVPGIWGGIFFIIAGAFGVAAVRTRSKGMVVTFLVLSIISACLAVPAFSMAAIGIANDNDFFYGNVGAAVAMDTLLLILAIAELVIAIVSSGIGCGVLCCRTHRYVQHVNDTGQSVQYVNMDNSQTNIAQHGSIIARPQVTGAQPQAAHPTQQWQQGSQSQAAYPTQQWQQGPQSQAAYPTQPWQQGPQSQAAYPTQHWQQGPSAPVAGPYPPQGLPPYTQEPAKQNLAGDHGVSDPQPPTEAPPPYNPETNYY